MTSRSIVADEAPIKEGVHFFPIRHHSPTCALALRKALDELQPTEILVEAPIDFETLLPLLTDPRTLAPVAILSLPPSWAEDSPVSTYPFCIHSPELIALSWARRNQARATLIDLPARHEAMAARFRGGVQGPLVEDWRLDHNRYVAELCARRGAPDGAALWDALFENHGAQVDWRGFFGAVAAYCEHIRAVTPDEEMQADGTLARENHMAGRLAEAMERGGRVAVVTGGFHTPALKAALARPVRSAPVKAPPQSAHLIRYGFRQLDQAGGYGAGLPHPAWYNRLWQALDGGGDPAGLAAATLLDFAEHLRRTAPGLALPTPVVVQAAMSAARLASLRDLAFAGRAEVIDALRSTAVKDAIEIGRTPLLEAFSDFMTGDVIGDLPPGAVQPPIVESVRQQAMALGFRLEGGERRARDLDILRKPRHARASHLLFALDLVEAGFASRVSGPDPISGWREDALFETWTYAWSPLVESRLIARAADGQTLERLCRAELLRRREALAVQGLARSTAALAALLLSAARTGYAEVAALVLDWCREALVEDPDVGSVVRALSLTAAVAASDRGPLGQACFTFRGRAFERLLMLFPGLTLTPPERLTDLIRALADLAALAGDEDAAIDRQALVAAVTTQPADLPPALDGALAAFAGLIGALDEEAVSRRVEAALDGTYVQTGGRAAALTGCLMVNPRLLVHSERLLSVADRFLGGLDTSSFLEVLPELRLATGQLSPSEIDRVADWVSGRHGLSVETLRSEDAPLAEVAANLLFSDRLEQGWREDGLAGWMGSVP